MQERAPATTSTKDQLLEASFLQNVTIRLHEQAHKIPEGLTAAEEAMK